MNNTNLEHGIYILSHFEVVYTFKYHRVIENGNNGQKSIIMMMNCTGTLNM